MKYGAESMITDKLIMEYKHKREENFSHIISELKDITNKLDDGFVDNH